jgi:hypothetical protein
VACLTPVTTTLLSAWTSEGRPGELDGRYGECLSLFSEDPRFYPNRVLLRGEATPYTCTVAPENGRLGWPCWFRSDPTARPAPARWQR